MKLPEVNLMLNAKFVGGLVSMADAALSYRCLGMGLLGNQYYPRFFSGKERKTTILHMEQFKEEEISMVYAKFRPISP